MYSKTLDDEINTADGAMMKTWRKRLLIGSGAGLALLLILFLYVNSGLFLKHHVLPRIGQVLDEPVAVEAASLSLFGHLTLTGFRLGPADAPKVTVDRLHVQHQLLPLLSGRLVIDAITIETMIADLSQEDVRKWLARQPTAASDDQEKTPGSPKQPPQITVKNVQLTHLAGTWKQEGLTAGFRQASVDLPLLSNGNPFELTLSGELFLQQEDADIQIKDGSLQVTGELGQDLLPTSLTVAARSALHGHAGTFPLAARTVTLDSQITAADGTYSLAATRLELNHGDAAEAIVTLDGSITPAPLQADLALHLELPDGNALTMAGQLIGDYTFGQTSVVYDADLNYGEQVSARGQLTVSALSVNSPTLGLADLPVLDVSGQHEFTFDAATGTLSVEHLTGSVRQDDQTLAELTLDKPTAIAIKQGAQPTSEPATFTLTTRDLDTRLLKPFLQLPEAVTLDQGYLTNTLTCTIRENGKMMSLEGDFSLSRLSIAVQEKVLDNLSIQAAFAADASLVDGLEAALTKLETEVKRGDRIWTSVKLDHPLRIGNSTQGLAQKQATSMTLAVPGLPLSDLGKLAPEVPQADLARVVLDSDLKVTVARLGQELSVDGTGKLAGLDAEIAGTTVESLGARYKLEASLADLQRLQLTTLQLELTQYAEPLLMLVVEGTLQTANRQGTLQVTINELPPAGRELISKLAGGIDLNRADLAYQADIGLDGERIDAKGKLTIDHLTAPVDFPPLAVTIQHDVSAAPARLELRILSVDISDPEASLLTAGLKAPASLQLPLDQAPATLTLQAILEPFALQRLNPLLPPANDLNIEGNARLRSTATIHLPSLIVEADGQASLTAFAFKQGKSQLQPIDLQATWQTKLQQDGMLTITNLQADLASKQQNLLTGRISGNLDTRLQGRKSTLQIRAPHPIDLGELQALYQAEEKPAPETDPTPEPDPEPKEPVDWSRFWIVADVSLAEVRYRDVVVEDIAFQAEFKDGVLELPESDLLLNGETLTFQTRVDLTTADGPTFQGKSHLQALPLAPFVSSFVPKLPVGVSGGFQDIAFSLNGNGLDKASLRKNLIANLAGQFDNFTLLRKPGLAADALEALLLKNFDLTWDDLRFHDGQASLNYADSTLSLPNMKMTADRFMLLWDGNMTFADKAVPDFTVIPAFRGKLADQLRKKGLNLSQGERGYWQAPPLPLQGDFYKPTNLLKLGVSYNVRLGILDPRYQAVNSGLDALGSLGDLFKKQPATTDEQPPDGDQKAKVQDAIKDIFNAYQSIENAEQDKDPPADEPKDENKEKPSTADQVRDVLKLFE